MVQIAFTTAAVRDEALLLSKLYQPSTTRELRQDDVRRCSYVNAAGSPPHVVLSSIPNRCLEVSSAGVWSTNPAAQIKCTRPDCSGNVLAPLENGWPVKPLDDVIGTGTELGTGELMPIKRIQIIIFTQQCEHNLRKY